MDVGLGRVFTVGAELSNWVWRKFGKTLIAAVGVAPVNVLGDVNTEIDCADELAHVHAARKARWLADGV